ncbi:MAG TPA: outer membrane beta-barrel domain-containing protein [Polyangia bacterium]|jgi:outer membrane beta-barrel protein
MVALLALLLAAPGLIGSGGAGVARAEEACIDNQAAQLGAKGARKGVQKREFLKRLRLEATIWGGFFASDLLSSSYDYGGALAFYPFEDLGIEASVLVTPFSLAVERPLTQFFAGRVFERSLAYVVVGNLIWSPIHLKMRATEHAIVHGDLLFALGAGDTINPTVQGATFDVGIGLKLYPNRWIAVRFDLRDYLMLQEAVAVQRVTNNIIGTLGISLFLPGPRGGK